MVQTEYTSHEELKTFKSRKQIRAKKVKFPQVELEILSYIGEQLAKKFNIGYKDIVGYAR